MDEPALALEVCSTSSSGGNSKNSGNGAAGAEAFFVAAVAESGACCYVWSVDHVTDAETANARLLARVQGSGGDAIFAARLQPGTQGAPRASDRAQ